MNYFLAIVKLMDLDFATSDLATLIRWRDSFATFFQFGRVVDIEDGSWIWIDQHHPYSRLDPQLVARQTLGPRDRQGRRRLRSPRPPRALAASPHTFRIPLLVRRFQICKHRTDDRKIHCRQSLS